MSDTVRALKQGQRLLRKLTPHEKQMTDKYRLQLAAARAEVGRLEELLGDLAITFAGREGVVFMTEDALYEPGANDG